MNHQRINETELDLHTFFIVPFDSLEISKSPEESEGIFVNTGSCAFGLRDP